MIDNTHQKSWQSEGQSKDDIKFFNSLCSITYRAGTHYIRDMPCRNCRSKVFYISNNSCVACDKSQTPRLSPEEMLFYAIKRRAKRKSLEFNLDIKWIAKSRIANKSCPILGIPLDFKKQSFEKRKLDGLGDFLVSCDRIDNTKGYTKDNCIFVSNRANKLKKDSSIEDLMLLTRFYENLGDIKLKFDAEWKKHFRQSNLKSLSKENPKIYRSYVAMKKRARNKGLDMKISQSEFYSMKISQNSCPIFGFEYVDSSDAFNPQIQNIDRIDSAKGYTVENVIIISGRGNQIKGNSTPNEIRLIMNFMKLHKEENIYNVKLRKFLRNGYLHLEGSFTYTDHFEKQISIRKRISTLKGSVEDLKRIIEEDFPFPAKFEYRWVKED